MTKPSSGDALDERVVDALKTLANGPDVTVYLAARLHRVSADELIEALLDKAEVLLEGDMTPQAVASSLGVTHGFLTLELRRRNHSRKQE